MGSSHSSHDAASGASAAANNADDAKKGDVVVVNEVARFPLVGSVTELSSGWSSLIRLAVVVARADISDLSVSEDQTGNEPCKTSASKWAGDASGECSKDVTFGGSVEELDDSHDDGGHVDDESPHEPGDELGRYVRVSWGCNSHWGG